MPFSGLKKFVTKLSHAKSPSPVVQRLAGIVGKKNRPCVAHFSAPIPATPKRFNLVIQWQTFGQTWQVRSVPAAAVAARRRWLSGGELRVSQYADKSSGRRDSACVFTQSVRRTPPANCRQDSSCRFQRTINRKHSSCRCLKAAPENLRSTSRAAKNAGIDLAPEKLTMRRSISPSGFFRQVPRWSAGREETCTRP